MVVVWQRPADTKAFDEHYFGTHVPLACARDRQLLGPNDAVQMFLFDDREV
jgi:hypothetical protein